MNNILLIIVALCVLNTGCLPQQTFRLRSNSVTSSTHAEHPSSQLTATTGLDGLNIDQRRCAALTAIDQAWPSEQQNGDVTKKWFRLKRDWAEANYQDKVTTIFAGIEHCGFDSSRVSEANGLLRYSMFNRWPSQNGSVWFNTEAAWNHANLGRAFRIYFLYRDKLESDVLAEFNIRVSKFNGGAPSTTQTENINLMINTASYLGAELNGRTNESGYQLIKDWIIEELHITLEHGYWESGSNYMSFTYSALLNLVDFAQDEEVRKLAWASLDFLFIQQSEFSLANNFSGPAVRQYDWGSTTELRRIQTVMNDIYFGPFRSLTNTGSISDTPAYLIVNNYRPYTILGDLLSDNSNNEVKATNGSFSGLGSRGTLYTHKQYLYSGQNFSLSAIQRFQDEGEAHHNFVNVVIQSKAQSNAWVIPWSFPEGHQVSAHHRSFAYKNVAFMQDGGNNYSDGPLPAKIYAHKSFSVVDIQQCFAFLSDGITYVAWIPSLGVPIREGNYNDGFFIRSSRTLDEYWGEFAIFEVGDATSYGNFDSFKQSIRSRVGGCPGGSTSQMRWMTKDGVELIFTRGSAKINGVNQDYSSYSRLSSKHINANAVYINGKSLFYDLESGDFQGATDRFIQLNYFGQRAPYPFEPSPCAQSEFVLCLGPNQKFKVNVDFRHNGAWNQAHMLSIAGGESGSAWFFNENNPEVMLKIIDGRTVNGKFWYYQGQLSDLEFKVTVTDSQTGRSKIYHNPAGQNRGVADVSALPLSITDNRTGSCAASETVFCSQNNRFETQIQWRDYQGNTGSGHFSSQNGVSATAWFFTASNKELMIKILDGRSINGNFWVYFGALSDVYYHIRIRDTVTGVEKTYTNQAGQQKGIVDTTAF